MKKKDYVRAMIRFYIRLERLGRPLLPLVIGWLWLITTSSQAQITLNVTNFGARGDAVQFWVNTTSNSAVVTTTNQLSSADVGKAVEIFQAGTQTYGVNSYGTNAYGNQDLTATISNVANGTNVTISVAAQSTLTNAFATYGTDNTIAFSNSLAACNGTNDIINIPAGEYLFIPYTNNLNYGLASIWVRRGGVHFIGASMTNTVLLSRGAWGLTGVLNGGTFVWRGYLFEFYLPITNDYPSSIESLTMDGGLQVGNMSATLNPGEYANPVDGLGWDTTSDAITVGGSGNNFTHITLTNLLVTHWRGEMIKSLDGSTNGNANIFNCDFVDGNATAINYYPALNVTGCVFSNLFQIAEYYQNYSTNISYFQNNLIVNITGNGFAINGGKGNNPPFVIQNNTFYFPGNGRDGILTGPGDNVYILTNQFNYTGPNGVAIAIGPTVGSYQGYFNNSNIVIAANNFISPSRILWLGSGPPNDAASVLVYSNILYQTNLNSYPLHTDGYSTNVHFFNNDFSTHVVNSQALVFSSGSLGSQFALVDTNNNYFTTVSDGIGVTNYISYANGSRFEVVNAFHPGTVYALTDTNASQIPVGAHILIQNNNTSSNSIPVYLNSSLTRGPVSVDYGQSFVASWSHGIWATNVPSIVTGLRIVQ